jgi:hypothetical protein
MVNLIVWMLVVHGLTQIVTCSKAVSPLRRLVTWIDPSWLGHGIRCPMCVGFWCGFALHVSGLLSLACVPNQRWLGAVLAGCVSSAWCYFAHVVQVRLGSKEL